MTMMHNKYLDQIEKLQDAPIEVENLKNKVVEYKLQDKEIVIEEDMDDCFAFPVMISIKEWENELGKQQKRLITES